jgi:hypothetical protein
VVKEPAAAIRGGVRVVHDAVLLVEQEVRQANGVSHSVHACNTPAAACPK